MILQLFRGGKEVLPRNVISLDDFILRTIDRAEREIKRDHPQDALKLLKQADHFYQKRGYDFKVECRLNKVLFAYAKKYDGASEPRDCA